MRPTTKTLLAISAAVSLGLAACGEDQVVTPPVSGEVTKVQETTTTTAPPVVVSVDDESSTLRAELTTLLQEHAYLTGIALERALDGGADDPATQAALDALDQNTVALGDVVGAIPGVEDREAFVELWRDHIGSFVDHAVARSEDDQQGVDAALDDLAAYTEAAADFFEQATETELSAADLTGELQTHVDSVTAVVDALAGQGDAEADPLQLLRDAAAHMEVVGTTLAEGIVGAFPDEYPGDPVSVPATTRADLTAGLQEQVYLSVLVAEQLAEAGKRTDESVTSAITMLEGATEGLATTVGAATGVQERASFLDALRPLNEALISYAEARAGGDDAAAEAARAQLDAAVSQATTALSQLAGGADLGGLLQRHVELITTSFDSITAGEGLDPSLAVEAARGARDLGLELASGIVLVSEQEDAAEGQGSEGEEAGDPGDGFGETPDEAGQGTTGGGTVDGPTPGAGADLTGPGVEEPEEPPSDPSQAGGPSPDGER